MDVKKLTQCALLTALTFVVTRFIQVPIPLGYFNIGNCIILLGCVLIPSPYGVIAGSLGSALADLTSFPVYTLPTLVIKALMPIVFYFFLKKGKEHKYAWGLAGEIVSTLIPLVGYTLVGGFLYGGLVAGFAQVPGLLLEYAANAVIFAVFLKPILAAGKAINREYANE